MKKIIILLTLIISITACQDESKNKHEQVTATEQPAHQDKKPAFDHKAYKMKGMIIAKSTFKTFKSKIEAIGQKEGLPAVVDFCHDNAMKLTDSIGKAHQVVIKRTSHKLRNPDNKPDIDEEAVLNEYLKLQKEQKEMTPVVLKDSEGYVHFYAPIKIKKACLQCHGEPIKDIPQPVLEKIKEKYPNDQATGFKIGELRGIWDIKFLNKQK